MILRRTTLITIGCIAGLAGLGLARRISVEPSLWWPVFSPAALLLRHKRFTAVFVVVLLGLMFGLWRGDQYMQKLRTLQNYTGQKVTVTASATTDSVYSNKSQIEFTANKVMLSDGQPLAGNFKISGFGVPMVYRGDKVKVTAKLFPTRGSNQARMAYAQIQRLAADNSWINRFTRRFNAGMESALPEPQASFGLGLLIGQRSNLPQEILNQLALIGLIHIVAVSGYNLTIIIRFLDRLKIGSKYQKLVLSLAFIGLFLMVTGFSASIVRAAIVSILSLWSWFYGRQLRPILLLAFTAALTGLISPFYVWSDLGWYLSFLAFFGVLILAPLLSSRIFRRQPPALSLMLVETLSAEIMTLPLIMAIFGRMSAIAIIANMLVLPLVPLAMLLAATAAGAGMFLPAAAGWFAWPARILLTYMLDIARVFANLPSLVLHNSLSPVTMIACYGLVIFVSLVLHHRKKAAQRASANTLNVLE